MKRRAPVLDRDALSAEIASLSKLGIDELRERWKAKYGKTPSQEIGRSFLTRAIAYRLQERAYGGLKPSTRRLLARTAEESATESSPKKPQLRKAQSGTMLIREWQGNAHRVTMLDDGVSFNGKHYRSLSEVAREITGSRWSGPRFFGCDCLRWRTIMERPKSPIRRCAIYTRKSSEEGLEQDFNSLHAQREACEAFIKSQAGEGWRLFKAAYDDGGLSGGTMERPALQRLLADINQGLIDVVVVYKVDRLTRSLTDFAKMVEVFDARGVSFVAVTQQFNTTTSMGRLTLNVLLSFAQFEREVTGERIRDKIAASKKKGMWMGGLVPLGYDVHERRLAINQSEAETVREIFRRYLELGSVRLLMEDLNRRGIRSKVRVAKNGKQSGGNPFFRGALYSLLSNPIYIGEIRHKGVHHPGLHEPIVERKLWDATQLLLRSHAVRRAPQARKSAPSPLTGRIFDESGQSLTPSHAVKGERRYRYYVSRNLVKETRDSGGRGWRLPAAEIERTVATAACQILSDHTAIAEAADSTGLADHLLPSIFSIAAVWMKRLQSEVEVGAALNALVERVELTDTGIRVSLKLPKSITEEQQGANATELTVTRVFPMQIRRRGFEMRLVIQGSRAPAPLADLALIKAIARGRLWSDDLLAGRVESVAVIAKREGVLPNYVRRLTRLAFLAPKIVEAIAAGHQPPELTAKALTERIELPLLWNEQERSVGIN